MASLWVLPSARALALGDGGQGAGRWGRVMTFFVMTPVLQLGAVSTDRLVVMRLGLAPVADMTQISAFRLRVALPAMDLPSGDQVGLLSLSLDVVSFLAVALAKFGFPRVPGAVIVQMLRSLPLSRV